MMTSFDNNEDKVCLLLKDDLKRSRVRSRARSYDLGFLNHVVTHIYSNLINERYKQAKPNNLEFKKSNAHLRL